MRDTAKTLEAYSALDYDSSVHSLAVVPLDLSELETVSSFAQQTLQQLGSCRLGFLFLNAAANHGVEERPGHGQSKWTESYIVNHLAHHYLVHLLKDKLVNSRSRIIFTSSGAVAYGDPGKCPPSP